MSVLCLILLSGALAGAADGPRRPDEPRRRIFAGFLLLDGKTDFNLEWEKSRGPYWNAINAGKALCAVPKEATRLFCEDLDASKAAASGYDALLETLKKPKTSRSIAEAVARLWSIAPQDMKGKDEKSRKQRLNDVALFYAQVSRAFLSADKPGADPRKNLNLAFLATSTAAQGRKELSRAVNKINQVVAGVLPVLIPQNKKPGLPPVAPRARFYPPGIVRIPSGSVIDAGLLMHGRDASERSEVVDLVAQAVLGQLNLSPSAKMVYARSLRGLLLDAAVRGGATDLKIVVGPDNGLLLVYVFERRSKDESKPIGRTERIEMVFPGHEGSLILLTPRNGTAVRDRREYLADGRLITVMPGAVIDEEHWGTRTVGARYDRREFGARSGENWGRPSRVEEGVFRDTGDAAVGGLSLAAAYVTEGSNKFGALVADSVPGLALGELAKVGQTGFACVTGYEQSRYAFVNRDYDLAVEAWANIALCEGWPTDEVALRLFKLCLKEKIFGPIDPQFIDRMNGSVNPRLLAALDKKTREQRTALFEAAYGISLKAHPELKSKLEDAYVVKPPITWRERAETLLAQKVLGVNSYCGRLKEMAARSQDKLDMTMAIVICTGKPIAESLPMLGALKVLRLAAAVPNATVQAAGTTALRSLELAASAPLVAQIPSTVLVSLNNLQADFRRGGVGEGTLQSVSDLINYSTMLAEVKPKPIKTETPPVVAREPVKSPTAAETVVAPVLKGGLVQNLRQALPWNKEAKPAGPEAAAIEADRLVAALKEGNGRRGISEVEKAARRGDADALWALKERLKNPSLFLPLIPEDRGRLLTVLSAHAETIYFDKPKPAHGEVMLHLGKRLMDDPANVRGVASLEEVMVQSKQDCQLHAIWNHPMMRYLHEKMTYELFRTRSEEIIGRKVSDTGTSLEETARLLKAFGIEKGAAEVPASESVLLAAIQADNGVMGGIHLRSLDHALMISAAIKQANGSWRYLVYDSLGSGKNASTQPPRLYSFAELSLMGLKIERISFTSDPGPGLSDAARMKTILDAQRSRIDAVIAPAAPPIRFGLKAPPTQKLKAPPTQKLVSPAEKAGQVFDALFERAKTAPGFEAQRIPTAAEVAFRRAARVRGSHRSVSEALEWLDSDEALSQLGQEAVDETRYALLHAARKADAGSPAMQAAWEESRKAVRGHNSPLTALSDGQLQFWSAGIETSAQFARFPWLAEALATSQPLTAAQARALIQSRLSASGTYEGLLKDVKALLWRGDANAGDLRLPGMHMMFSKGGLNEASRKSFMAL